MRVKPFMDSPTDERYHDRANVAEAKMGAQVFKPLATPTPILRRCYSLKEEDSVDKFSWLLLALR